MRMPWSFLQSTWPVLRKAAGSSPSVMAAVKESKGQRIVRRAFAEEVLRGSEAAKNKQHRLASREGARGSRNRLGATGAGPAPPTVLGEQTAPPSAAWPGCLPNHAENKQTSCRSFPVPSLSWDGATIPRGSQWQQAGSVLLHGTRRRAPRRRWLRGYRRADPGIRPCCPPWARGVPVPLCPSIPCRPQRFLIQPHILWVWDCPLCPGLAGHQEGHLCRDDSMTIPHG